MTYAMHMAQHVLLSQVVPLVVVWRFGARIRLAAPPAVAWAVGVATTIALALPAAFAAAMHDGVLMGGMRLALVAGGLLFWTPVWRTAGGARASMSRATAVVYLVTACFATTLAGAAIAFHARTTDEQVGGLVMWVPCCLVYLGAVLAIVGATLRAPRPTHEESLT